MFDFIKREYDLEYESALKLSKNTYKISSNGRPYLLKIVDDDSMHRIYARLAVLNPHNFLLPLKGKDFQFVHFEEGKYYILENYLSDEAILGYDLKISFFIKSIASLHHKTYISLSINDNYLESTLNYLDEQIKKVSEAIEARMEVCEHLDYHSPNDWYFMMHYNTFKQALELASKHVLNFENKIRELKSLKICFTYQNFDFDHILLGQEKIVSLEKMGYNFAGFDLYQMITKINIDSLQINQYLNEYLKINPLEEYEKDYLMALLYTIDYHRFESCNEDLTHLINLVKYIEKVDSIENDLIFSSEQVE